MHDSRIRPFSTAWLIILCVGLLGAQLAAAAEVTATLDRTRIVLGETVTLVLQTDDPGQSLEGDLSALDQDFLLLDRRSETQMSIVNGSRSAEVRMSLVLEPKRNGRLTIPSLPIGDGGTQPLEINVDAAPTPMPGEMPAVFIEVAVTPEDVPAYVHAQLGLTVRVFYQQNLTEAAISQPEPSPASVRLLDEVPFQSSRNGTRYRVLERHYAIFPERSGELVIPPLKLSGRLVERRGDRLWQPNVRGRRIEVESDEIRLDIKPRPASFAGDSWQPARSLELMQQISAADALKVGEPVTRTVIVDALGLEENMITEPVWPEIPDARIYPDQPQGISRDDGQWVLGHKEFRYAVVPEKEGELVLPELKVEWWDTVNDRQQTAVLPAKVLQVLPSVTAPLSPQLPQAPDSNAINSLPQGAISGGAPSYWRWLTALFAFLWLATLAAWRVRGSRGTTVSSSELEHLEKESALLGQLKHACERDDRGQTRRLLSQWISRFGPKSAAGSVLQFASSLDDEALKTSIHELDSAGFRKDDDPAWDSKRFWKQFEAWHKARSASPAGEAPSVTDLYAVENRQRVQ
jgi:hypothetical protein